MPGDRDFGTSAGSQSGQTRPPTPAQNTRRTVRRAVDRASDPVARSIDGLARQLSPYTSLKDTRVKGGSLLDDYVDGGQREGSQPPGVRQAGITGGFNPNAFNQAATDGDNPLGGPIEGALGTIFRKLDAPAYPAGSALMSTSPGEILPNIGKGIAAWQAEWGKTPGLDRLAPAAPFFKDKKVQEGAVLPSESIRARGWENALRIPGPVDDIGLGIIADTAGNPTSYLSFGTGSSARAASAATSASIASRGAVRRAARQLGPDDLAVTRAAVPGQAATPAVAGKVGRQARQSRAVRWNPGQGPDLIPGPGRARPAPRPDRPVPAARGSRTRLENVPYPPTARAQTAVDEFGRARSERPPVSASPRAAARAGAEAQAAQAASARAQAQLVRQQREWARAEAELPAVRTQVRELSTRLNELKADTTANPRTVSITAQRLKQAEQQRDLLAATVARARRPQGSALPRPDRAPTFGEAVRAAASVTETKLAHGGVRVAGEGGVFKVVRGTSNGKVNWTVEASSNGAAPRSFPTRAAAVTAAREKAAVPTPAPNLAAPARSTVRPFSSGTYTPRQARGLAASREQVRGLERRLARLEAQPGSSRPEVARTAQRLQVARARLKSLEAQGAPRGADYVAVLSRVKEKQRRAQIAVAARDQMTGGITPRGATKEAVRIGKRQERARADLRRVQSEVYRRPPRQPVGEPQNWRRSWGEQPEAAYSSGNLGNRAAAFSSKPELLIQAEMDVTEAGARAARDGSRGIHVYLPGQKGRGSGTTITIPGLRHGDPGSSLPSLGGARPTPAALMSERAPLVQWVHKLERYFVTQYGPNRIVADGARGADSWVNNGRNLAIEHVGDLMKRFKVSKADRVQASHYREALDQPAARKAFVERYGIQPEAAPQNVKDFAREVTEYVDRLTDDYIQAGGSLRRLRKNYVYHAYRPNELDEIERRGSALAAMIDKYGDDPKFAKQRGMPTLAEAKDAGLDPIEDLAEIAILRATAHHRSIADMGLINIIRRKYGQKAASLTDEGVVKVGDEYRSAPGSRWSQLSKYTDLESDKDVFVPTDVAQTLSNVDKARGRISSMPLKGLRDINRHYKFMALLSSGYHIRNFISDAIRDMQTGGNPFGSIRRGFQMAGRRGRHAPGAHGEARRMSDMMGATGSGHVAAELVDEPISRGRKLASRGMGGARQAGGKELTGHSRLRRATVGNYRKFSTARENLLRAGRFAERERKVGPVMARRHVAKTFYDYGDVGSIIDVMRRYPIAPFVTWPVKNIPGQVRSLAANPKQAIAMSAAYRNAQAEFDLPDPWMLPEWFRARAPIATPWGYMGFDNPAADLSTVVPGQGRSGQEVAQGLAGQLGPLTQLPFVATGNNPVTGIPFRDQQPATPMDMLALQALGPIGERIFEPGYTTGEDADGNKIGVPSVKGMPQWALNALLPVGGIVGRTGALDRAAGETEESNRSFLDRGLSTVGGVRIKDPFNVAELEAGIRRREYEKSRVKADLTKAKAGARDAGVEFDERKSKQYRRIKRIEEDIKTLTRMLAEARRRERD